MNELYNLTLWALCVYGITSIITTSYLFYTPRVFISSKSPWLGQLLTCSNCCGFWVGFVLSKTLTSVTGNAFFDACVASAIMLLMGGRIDPWNGQRRG